MLLSTLTDMNEENKILDDLIRVDFIDSDDWLNKLNTNAKLQLMMQESKVVNTGMQKRGSVTDRRMNESEMVRESINNDQFLNMSQEVTDKRREIIAKDKKIQDLSYELDNYKKYFTK